MCRTGSMSQAAFLSDMILAFQHVVGKDGQESHTMEARLAIADALTFSAYFQSMLRNP